MPVILTRNDPRFHDQRLYKGGGGGGSPYYANLDLLYDQQAKTSQDLRTQSQRTFADLERLRGDARNFGSQAMQDRAAVTAYGDSRRSSDQEMRSLSDNMASMGINPGDERFMRQMRAGGVQSAADAASAATGARVQQQNLGFARQQDVTSMGLGLPGQATAAANSAGQMASNAGQLKLQQSAQTSANIGGAVRGGIDLYGMLAMKDGGYVQRPMRMDNGTSMEALDPQFEVGPAGGMVQKLARGGIVGAMRDIQATPPPVGTPKAPPQRMSPAAAAGIKGFSKNEGARIQGYGEANGNSNLTALGAGMQGNDPSTAVQMAGQQVDAAANTIPGMANSAQTAGYGVGGAESTATALEASGATAAEAAEAGGALATTAGAEAGVEGVAAAAGEGVLGAFGAAGTALGVAMPWVGAAMLVGSALGLFKDGGPVGGGQQYGGEVDGPGGPKDDRIPAMLSDGEFIMPVGAVKKFGLDRLEKMRQEGLAFEQQLGIR